MRNSTITIRQAQSGDVEAMIAVVAEVFEPASLESYIAKAIGQAPVPWLELKAQSIRDEFAASPAGCFVAVAGGKVVGGVTTCISPRLARGTVSNLAVSKAVQGKGVGRRLIERCLDYFRSLGLKQARIDTLECNEAGKHLYPQLGFREVMRHVHYVMPL
ncbi:MAG: GNAT family N-acetyltransferase [Phycisphaerae bacterium]